MNDDLYRQLQTLKDKDGNYVLSTISFSSQYGLQRLIEFIESRDAEREAAIRVDESKKVYSLTKPLLPNSGSPDGNIRAWIKDREQQLEAIKRKEEV